MPGDPLDPEMEPDTSQQDAPAGQDEEEDEEEADPVLLAKKQKQLAKRGVTFEAKVDPKVLASHRTEPGPCFLLPKSVPC